MVAASNAVNLTDGLDGLAVVPSIISFFTLSLLVYITGHATISSYLLMPSFDVGEVAIIATALMGALAGMMDAQYDVLRKNGHSPSEAFNETVEELTQSLIRLVDENGMDWMYSNCSANAQRGALDWRPKFKEAVLPVFNDLYNSVKTGEETRIVLEKTGAANYKESLEAELKEMRESEIWQAGAAVRSLRPKS